MSPIIRAPMESEIPQMVEMGRRFFKASGYADITEFDSSSFRATLERTMRSLDGLLLVVAKYGLVGMAGAVVYPFYFNVGHKTAQELFWWVDPEHRGIGGKLFDAMCAAAKEKGAVSLSMIALDALEPEKVGAFYRRRGFRPSEHSYIGRL